MKKFSDIEELMYHMYNTVEDDMPVSVIAGKDLAIGILREFLYYDDTKITIVDIDSLDYDREYFIGLTYDPDDDKYKLSVEKAYCYETGKYIGTDGIVLFHEDVNSKALVDMQSNKYAKMTEYDWFTFYNDVDEPEDDEESDAKQVKPAECKDTDCKFFVNGKPATKEQYDKATENLNKSLKNELLFYCEFMDEMNEWRKLLRWQDI